MFKTTIAHEIWQRKYKYGKETPIETFERVAKSLASVEKNPDEWYPKFLKTLVKFDHNNKPIGLKCIPGGRITANIGTTYSKATLINCFVSAPVSNAHLSYMRRTDDNLYSFPVEYVTDQSPDDLINIFLTIAEQAKTLASEGGYGVNFDFIRPRGALIKGTGIKHPGVVAYMKIWDAVSQCIVQGDDDGYYDKIKNYLDQTTLIRLKKVSEIVKEDIRKGAMVAVLSCWHPDAEEFIRAKQTSGILTKFNISVLLDDKFMKAVENDDFYDQHFNGKTYKRIKARDLYNLIMESTYNRAEPGVLFADNMMKNNPVAYLGKLTCVNPCFSGDTFLFTKDGCHTFDFFANKYRNTVEILQDNRVTFVGTPEKEDWSVDLNKTGYHYNEASSVFKTKCDVKTYKVKFVGGVDLVLTEDHHLMTSKGPIQVSNLKTNDNVLFCLPEIPTNLVKSSLDDAAFLLGLVDSDGGVVEDPDKYIVYIDLYDKKLEMKDSILKKIDTLYKLYGIEIALEQNRPISAYYITEDEKRNRIGSAFLYRLFIKYFNWAGKKNIPDIFFLYSRKYSFAINYIAGFFVCDGHNNFTKNGDSLRINQSDEMYLKKFQALLWSIGIDSGLYLRRKQMLKRMPDGRGGHKNYLCKENYELIITKSFFPKFFGLFNLIKFSKLTAIDNRRLLKSHEINLIKRVKSISEDKIQDVYCLKEDKDRTLVANGVVARRCGEVPGLSNITTVCLLGSPNLTQYVKIDKLRNRYFDFDEYSEDIKIFMRMLDNVNDLTYAPLPSYQWVIDNLRQVGMGINGLGSALMMLGIPYNSKEAVEFAKKLAQIKENLTWQTSALLAKEKGTFKAYNKELFESTEFFKSDRLTKETKDMIIDYGVRNAKTTTCPPLGNSSCIADATTNGIEPVFDLEYQRKITCKQWPEGLSADNIKKILKHHKDKDFEYWQGIYNGKEYYYEPHNRGLCEINLVRDYGYQWLLDNFPNEDHSKYLVTCKDLKVEDHVAIQEVIQYYNSQSVSKTCNLPNNYPFEDFKDLYLLAWKRGLNGFTTYRADSMESVLSDIKKATKKEIITRDIKLPDVFINGDCHVIKREGKKFYIHFSYLPEDIKKEFPIVLWIYTNAKYKADELKICNKASKNLCTLALERGIDRGIIKETVDKANSDYPHNRLGRMVSLCLRHNIPREDILVYLMNIDGDNISTLVTAVRKFLSSTLPNGTILHGSKCPECGEQLIMDGGCRRCPSCSWTACG